MMDWRTLFKRYQRGFYDLLYVGAALRGATLYNIGYAPLDPELAEDPLTRDQPYQFQLYKLCVDEIRAQVPNPRRVAEIGSGLGAGADYIEKRLGLEVDALEPNRTARILSRVLYRKTAIAAEAPTLPLADASVDAILTIDSTTYFFVDDFFQEAIRVMKPGGALVVSDFRKRSYPKLRGMFRRAFERNGFTHFQERDCTENALEACRLDADRRRRFLAGLPSGLREEMAYSFGLPESEKFREMESGARSYIITSARSPVAVEAPGA